MPLFDRRSWFASVATAAGLSATPGWVRFFFGQGQDANPAHPNPRERQLRAAAQQAKAQGKPLLVFVVPADDQAAYVRGLWLGAFLNHGGAAARLDVALCVPACGKLDEVQRALGAAAIEGAPIALLLDVSAFGDPHAAAPRTTRLDLDLGAIEPERLAGESHEAHHAATQKHLIAGCARLVVALREALRQHGSDLTTLTASVRANLSDARRTALAAWLAGGKRPTDELLVRCAAEVQVVAGERPPAEGAEMRKVLGEAVERHVVARDVAGSRWYLQSTCIPEPERPTAEERTQAGAMCGMGFVPALCERFLSFYTQP